MNEATPKYIKELKIDIINHIDNKIENTEPKYFTEFKKDIRGYIDLSINELAIMIKDNFATKDDMAELRMEMATKKDVEKILSHIGRYEVRAQNTEETILQDHKPRIIDLEKEVFA